MREATMAVRRVRRILGIAVCVLATACAGSGQRADDAAASSDDRASDGFGGWVTPYPEGEWGQAWAVSGRGVTGVVPRGVAMPDCTGVEDESLLYVGDLLASPGSFVSTLDGALDQAAYRPLAASGFRLTGERAGGVIGVLQTTAGRRARFVLVWDVRPRLHDLVVYDAETGDVALRFEIPMPLAPHALVNLDPGEPEGFDLLFGPAPDGRLLLAAGENAALSFPLESLCAE